MALWGNKDDIYSPGVIYVNYTTGIATGAGTSFTAASEGDVISIGAGNTFGEAIISGITSDTLISIASTQYLSGQEISGVEYTVSQKPKYTLHDSHYGANQIYGVDENEAAAAVNTKYSVTHAGWVGIITYIDADNQLRVKTETLVAMSGITTGTTDYDNAGDAADDTIFQDSLILIISQPSDVGVGTTATATFTVSATSTPIIVPLTYQWQYSNTGVAYTDLSDDATYSGVTSTDLDVINTDTSLDEYYYRVVVSSSGNAADVISDPAQMIVFESL
jgi:hypothetical protein